MSPAGLLSQVFDLLDFPIRRVKCIAAWVLVAAAVLMPSTFSHAVTGYATREAAVIESRLAHVLAHLLPPGPARPTPTPTPR